MSRPCTPCQERCECACELRECIYTRSPVAPAPWVCGECGALCVAAHVVAPSPVLVSRQPTSTLAAATLSTGKHSGDHSAGAVCRTMDASTRAIGFRDACDRFYSSVLVPLYFHQASRVLNSFLQHVNVVSCCWLHICHFGVSLHPSLELRFCPILSCFVLNKPSLLRPVYTG